MDKLEFLGMYFEECLRLFIFYPLMKITPYLGPRIGLALILIPILILVLFVLQPVKIYSYRQRFEWSTKKNWQLRLYICNVVICFYCLIVSAYVETAPDCPNCWNSTNTAVFNLVWITPILFILFNIWHSIKTFDWWKESYSDNDKLYTEFKKSNLIYEPLNIYYLSYMIGVWVITFNYFLNLSLSKIYYRDIGTDSIFFILEISFCYILYRCVHYFTHSISQK